MILIDQSKQIHMDGVLEPVDTTNWYPKIMRKGYTVGLNITETPSTIPIRPFTGLRGRDAAQLLRLL